MTTFWLVLAGGLGAVLRFLVDAVVRPRVSTTLPVATILVNVTGSFALGLVVGTVMFHGAPQAWRSVAGSGLLGGYTTFSTASVETVRLLEDRALAAALVNLVGSAVLALLAAAAGLWIASAL